MSEQPIAISCLNDFIFCPVSIYFHALDADTDTIILQDVVQLKGTAAHKTVDTATYTTQACVLQGLSVYSEEYNLVGKIDTFDTRKGVLTERKKKIKMIYDGYIFQLYAQYFCLIEMGYHVNEMRLYSMDDNKVYPIPLPQHAPELYQKFIKTLTDLNTFRLENFRQKNEQKCAHCIYEPLCSYSARQGAW